MSKAEVKFPAAGGGGTPYALDILDEGNLILSNPGDINFAGAGVTVTESPTGTALVTIPGATATAWGTITGTLSNQTDLQNALNTKFTNGGNSFGATATIGTNDNFGFSIETNSIARLTISNGGETTFGPVGGNNVIRIPYNSNKIIGGGTIELIFNTAGLAIQPNVNQASFSVSMLVPGISWTPNTGTAVRNFVVDNGTINQTGTATGITRGFYAVPTLTAAADYRAFEALLSRVNANDTLIKLSNSSRNVFVVKGDDKIGLYTAAPVAQATTGIAAAVYVSGAGGNIKEDCTFDGYTVAQVVKALRDIGLLA